MFHCMTRTARQLARKHICIFVLIISIVTLPGCHGGINIFSPSPGELIHTADETFDAADAINLRQDNPEQIKNANSKRQELYKAAIDMYLETIFKDTKGIYSQRAHHEIAKIYTRLYQFDKAIEHYDAILKLGKIGYYPIQAKDRIANIGTNRVIIKDQFAKFQNSRISYQKMPSERTFNSGAEALYRVAQAYEEMEDYPEAIRTYQRIVDEFSMHEKAPKAQFQIGNIYFFDLYDYTNSGGWGAFVAAAQKFPDTYEAEQAKELLIKANTLLSEIKYLEDEIRLYSSKKVPKYSNPHGSSPWISKLTKKEIEDLLVRAFQKIAKNWVEMHNYPRAIQTYKTLVIEMFHKRNIPYKKSVIADALYNIANLHQENREYERAIHAYNNLLKKIPKPSERISDSIYQQAVCFHAIQRYTDAYKYFKTYIRLPLNDTSKRQKAKQLVQQFERDQDKDGFRFYEEQENGTSDQDPSSQPLAGN